MCKQNSWPNLESAAVCSQNLGRPKLIFLSVFRIVFVLFQVIVFHAQSHWSDLGGSLLILVPVLAMALEEQLVRRCHWRWL